MGEIWSQLLPVLYWIDDVKLAVVPPVLASVSVCAGGNGPPCASLKVSEVGETVTDTLEVTVSVTGTVSWKFGIDEEEITMLPL